MKEFKPCPFCGSEKELSISEHKSIKYILCNNCGANGPFETDKKTALEIWNERYDHI